MSVVKGREGGDPGIGGKKLSKSDSDVKLEARNKSYEKVLDLQIIYIREKTDEARDKWLAKSAWHEKEFGW